jgi:ribosomal-protein-alanine N-acetyltransferase
MQTERLRLRQPRIEDLPAYDLVIGDPRVPEHQFPARFRTPEFNAHLLQKAIDHWAAHGFGPYIVWLGDELIGRAGLITSTFEGRECVEAKWFLSPDHWGRGHATEAARAAVDEGFANGLP